MLRVTKELLFAFKFMLSVLKYSFPAGGIWFLMCSNVTRLVNLQVFEAFCFSLKLQSVDEYLC